MRRSAMFIGLFWGLLGTGVCFAQTSEELALTNCTTLIRQCCMPGGEIALNEDPSYESVRPYFANQACLALLANSNPVDQIRESGWLKWYAHHQLADGSINDWVGANGFLIDSGNRDSVDSYAATYLLACYRYQQAYGSLPADVLPAVTKAFDSMFSLRQSDGLTWALPNYHSKFLMDNTEVFAGAVAAQSLFAHYGDAPRKSRASSLQTGLYSSLAKFFRTANSLFAYNKNELGAFELPLPPTSSRSTTGLANLFGFAWISDRNQHPWQFVATTYAADSGPAPECPIEWFCIASTRQPDPAVTSYFRALTINEGFSFHATNSSGPSNYYVQRPAITVLALLKGSTWLPNRLDSKLFPKNPRPRRL